MITNTSELLLKQTFLFDFNHMRCPHCHRCAIDDEAFGMLYEARLLAKINFEIKSAYRCFDYNMKIGSLSTYHPDGVAFDIKTKNIHDRLTILNALMRAGFRRFGIHETFIHTDISKNPKAIWIS